MALSPVSFKVDFLFLVLLVTFEIKREMYAYHAALWSTYSFQEDGRDNLTIHSQSCAPTSSCTATPIFPTLFTILTITILTKQGKDFIFQLLKKFIQMWHSWYPYAECIFKTCSWSAVTNFRFLIKCETMSESDSLCQNARLLFASSWCIFCFSFLMNRGITSFALTPRTAITYSSMLSRYWSY